MQRIDNATAVTILPAPAAAGTAGYFNNQAPGIGQTPTIVDADWFNAVQEEIAAVILAAGIALDKMNRAQLLAAIRALNARGVQVFAAVGTTNFTVPANVTAVEVELWGGGAGSFASYGAKRSGGAGAGGYSRKRIAGLTPGATIAVTIGAGGVAGTTAGPSWPGNGGTSSFGAYATATGGVLNGIASPTSGYENGGTGGTASGGDLNITGSSGTPGGPASGGTNGMGGQPAIGSAIGSGTFGLPGIFPGGGAAGAGFLADGVTTQNGAAGAQGLCIVRW